MTDRAPRLEGMSDERLAEIAAREARATWTADLLRDDADTIADHCLAPNEEHRLPASHCWACRIAEMLNALADSRGDVPDLLAEVSRLRADGALLRERVDSLEVAIVNHLRGHETIMPENDDIYEALSDEAKCALFPELASARKEPTP